MSFGAPLSTNQYDADVRQIRLTTLRVHSPSGRLVDCLASVLAIPTLDIGAKQERTYLYFMSIK